MAQTDSNMLPPCERREYGLFEICPIRLSCKLHERPNAEHFDMHYALEVGIVLTGRMERSFHGHRRSLGAGQVWLCSAWEPHGWQVVEGPCSVVVASIFPPALANNRFPELLAHDWHAAFVAPPAQRPDVAKPTRPLIEMLGRELQASISVSEPRRLLLQRMLVYQVLLELPQVSARPPAEAPQEEAWHYFNRAVELVFRRRCFVSAEDAARACAVSKKSLNAAFHKATGTSFSKFALRYRLQAAASRLLETHDPVKAVALDWGFTDVSHFHFAFRVAYGCSPARYREARGTVHPAAAPRD